MRNNSSLKRKTGAAVTAALCGALVFGALPAQAAGEVTTGAVSARGQFGPVQNLAAEVTKPADAYQVDAAWSALSGAVRYNVALLRADGTTVEQASVTNPAWRVTTTERAGTQLQLRVVAVDARRKKSRPATVGVHLPDRTAPTATYRASSEDLTGTITQLTLTDDLSSEAEVTREVDWNDVDGSVFEPWGDGASTSHDFPRDEEIYHPVVRLTDLAGNERTYVVTVVIGDEEAPTGAYAVSPGTVWAAPAQEVTLTQVSLDDVFSDNANIQRAVDWRDGSAPETWTDGLTLSHTYTVAGSYQPVVHLTDEAGNVSEVSPPSAVMVNADTVAPEVTVQVPGRAVQRVATWRTVRGTAADVDGTGVAKVELRAVQKRGRVWYAYKGPRKVWVRAGATKAAANSKARPAFMAPTEQGTWSHTFGSLRKGTLIVTARSHDRAGNISQPAQVQQRLTRR